MVANRLFSIVLAWFAVHELDAIRRREWRFFFAPTPLDDETAYRAFTALHVPLFALLVGGSRSGPVQVGLDAFLIAHAALHFLLRDHPRVAFENRFSRAWIYGGATLGAIHLVCARWVR